MEKRKAAKEAAEELLQFIKESPDCFHAVEAQACRLRAEGLEELVEEEAWALQEAGRDFVTRNQASLIAYKLPKWDFAGFHILASHTDSTSLHIKHNPEM